MTTLPTLPNISGPEKPSPDLLNCGVCNTAFPLQDITAFIHHKATHCQDIKKEGESISNQRSPKSPTVSTSHTVETKKGKQK